MARVNVYIPDDLAEALAERDDLNVSAICQRALRAEVGIASAEDRIAVLETKVESLLRQSVGAR